MRRDGKPFIVDVMMAVARTRRRIQAWRSGSGAVGYRLFNAGSPRACAASEHACEDAASGDGEVLSLLRVLMASPPPFPSRARRSSKHKDTDCSRSTKQRKRQHSDHKTARLFLDTPTTFTIRPPPIRLAIALIPARPAASVLGESQLAESAQNGPLKA